jgi:hypothetical protein
MVCKVYTAHTVVTAASSLHVPQITNVEATSSVTSTTTSATQTVAHAGTTLTLISSSWKLATSLPSPPSSSSPTSSLTMASSSSSPSSSSIMTSEWGELVIAAYQMSKQSELLLETMEAALNPPPPLIVPPPTKGESKDIDNNDDEEDEENESVGDMTNGKKSRLEGRQFGIILHQIESAVPQDIKGRDATVIDILQQKLVNTGIASSILPYHVAIDWQSSRTKGGYGERGPPSASGVVYPFGIKEIEWLRNRSSVSSLSSINDNSDTSDGGYPGGGKIKQKSYYSSYTSASTMDIPFYHLSDGQWPHGRQLRHNANCDVAPNDGYGQGRRRSFSEDALYASAAAIVTLNELATFLMTILPSHMMSLSTIISGYLPSLHKWVVSHEYRINETVSLE